MRLGKQTLRKLVREELSKVNEGIEPQIKKIAQLTGTRPDAVEDFVSKHALNFTKLLKFLQKGKLKDRMDFVTAVSGKPGNPIQKKMIKMFTESVVNEGKFKVDDLVYNKRTKTVGIVRMGDDKHGEVKTDADGNVSVDELEKYNPFKYKHQTKAKVAPSTEREVSKRGLFNPFKLESVLNERPNKKEIEKLASELERQWRMNSGAMSVMIDDIPDKQMDKIRANFRKQAEKQLSESVNEGISVFDERHFGKNGIIIMIDDNGKKVSAIFKNKKNANKYNRNKESDLKALLSLAKKTPYPKAIDESINESILSEKKPSKIVWDTKKISAAKRINVRKWYMKTYPSDELGDEINQKLTLWDFYNALSQNRDIYKVIGVGDSVVRERIFEKLSKVLGVAYDTIYNMWESVNEANGKVDLSLPFAVIRKGGSIGSSTKNYIPTDKGVIVSTFNNQNDAKEEAASLRKTLSPQAKQYYKTTYTVTKLTDYKRKLIKNKTESINEASDEFVIYVEKDNGRKKLLHNNKSARAAKMFITKNANKILNQSGIRAVGSMRKSDWERDEAQYAENIKKKSMRTVTKKQWDRTHKDYKGMIKGQPYMMWFDKKTQSTVYGPVQIKESVNEAKSIRTYDSLEDFEKVAKIGNVFYLGHDSQFQRTTKKDYFKVVDKKPDGTIVIANPPTSRKKYTIGANRYDEKVHLVKESVNEGKDDFVARHGKANIILKKGYKHHKDTDLEKLYYKLGSLVKGLKVKDVTLVFESVNEDTKKRFDVDFYKGNGDRQTSHEEIIRGDKFSDIVSQATKVAKSKGMNYVEFYHRDSFIGSIDKRNGYQFKKGGDYQKSPLPVNEGRAFVAAAKKAKEEGKTEFEFNGKTYPVTIKEVLRKRNRKLR